MSIKVTAVAPNATAVQALAADLSAQGGGAVNTQVGLIDTICAEVVQARPDVVVAELPAPRENDLLMLGGALNSSPGTVMILLTADKSPNTLMGAMRAGVREVVHMPLANGELKEAYARQLDRLRQQRGIASRGEEAQVIGFVPAKGGAGATFLATSFAHALSRNGKRVALIDMNIHLGDAAIYLSDKPVASTVADLAQHERRLDVALLESTMLHCGANLWLLAAPESMESSVTVTPDIMGRILKLAQSHFDFVVLDLPRVPDAVSMRGLDLCRKLYLIAQSSMPFLHDGKRLLSALRELGVGRDRVELVINRQYKGSDLSVADVRTALHFDTAREIPNSYSAVAYAINHGVPLLRHAPKDPVGKALIAWAQEWQPAAEAEARNSGWLRGFTLGR